MHGNGGGQTVVFSPIRKPPSPFQVGLWRCPIQPTIQATGRHRRFRTEASTDCCALRAIDRPHSGWRWRWHMTGPSRAASEGTATDPARQLAPSRGDRIGPCRAPCRDSDLPSPAPWLRRGHVRAPQGLPLLVLGLLAASYGAIPYVVCTIHMVMHLSTSYPPTL